MADLAQGVQNLLKIKNKAYREGFEAGVEDAVKRLSSVERSDRQDMGLDISTIGLLRSSIKELPPELEIFDGSIGMPLMGEISLSWGQTKALFVYGKRCRPKYLGEPF